MVIGEKIWDIWQSSKMENYIVAWKVSEIQKHVVELIKEYSKFFGISREQIWEYEQEPSLKIFLLIR